MMHIAHKTYRRTRIQTAPNLISTLWQDSSSNQKKSFTGWRRQRYSSRFPSHLPGEGKEGKHEKSYTFLLCSTGKDKEYTICCLLLLDPKLDNCAAMRPSESWIHIRRGGGGEPNHCENVLGRTAFTCAIGNDQEHSACRKVGIARAGVACFRRQGASPPHSPRAYSGFSLSTLLTSCGWEITGSYSGVVDEGFQCSCTLTSCHVVSNFMFTVPCILTLY
jgi:hypothetical protein